ncbi:uncharacterized protein MELLADRAFT_107706 [Melampsora larici-populina 98AG31]|uniref:Uncharacterized protein n=1 Tax=Melampsora larici-populina (strain 98AG31 / pathotype 3-4-7) TaxID=747676 RepID=F4RQP1_MELLP|nr:uncharacterized protein MELLADRAFT_107706 [Melampsora larici-populina 98AG31]EGG05287.1 hypothetical protein MELLADRAFT_107706 [Melampsora larici-populina 98AG31]
MTQDHKPPTHCFPSGTYFIYNQYYPILQKLLRAQQITYYTIIFPKPQLPYINLYTSTKLTNNVSHFRPRIVETSGIQNSVCADILLHQTRLELGVEHKHHPSNVMNRELPRLLNNVQELQEYIGNNHKLGERALYSNANYLIKIEEQKRGIPHVHFVILGYSYSCEPYLA